MPQKIVGNFRNRLLNIIEEGRHRHKDVISRSRLNVWFDVLDFPLDFNNGSVVSVEIFLIIELEN